MPQRPDRPKQPDVTESDLEPVDSVSALSPIPLDTVPILVPVPSAPELTPVGKPSETLDQTGESSLPRPARTLDLGDEDGEPSEEQVADVPWPEPPKARPPSGSRAPVKSGAAKPVDVVSDVPSRMAKKRVGLRGDGFEHFEPTGGGDTQPDEVTTPRGRVEPLTIGLIIAGVALALLLVLILLQAIG